MTHLDVSAAGAPLRAAEPVRRWRTPCKAWAGRWALPLLLMLTSSGLLPAYATDSTQAAGEVVTAQQAARRPSGSRLDERVRILAKALDLNTTQQSAVRMLLVSQSEQVRRVWNNTSLPAANRVGATRAISDATADRIRALLNDEQKKKYNPPPQPREQAVNSAPSVEDWMRAPGQQRASVADNAPGREP